MLEKGTLRQPRLVLASRVFLENLTARLESEYGPSGYPSPHTKSTGLRIVCTRS